MVSLHKEAKRWRKVQEKSNRKGQKVAKKYSEESKKKEGKLWD
jgi:hypothetical protein